MIANIFEEYNLAKKTIKPSQLKSHLVKNWSYFINYHSINNPFPTYISHEKVCACTGTTNEFPELT